MSKGLKYLLDMSLGREQRKFGYGGNEKITTP
jgi:hypothetical protein